MQRTPFLLSVASLALAACGSEPLAEEPETAGARATPTVAASPTASASDVPAHLDIVSRYTSLKDCRVTKSNADEGGWSVSSCPGLGGYRLELTESDLRQNLVIHPPNGREHGLDPAEATGSGGFSRIGETVEWRGKGDGNAFRPDAMVVRYLVVEDPDTPSKETAYLLAVSLSPKPCVTGRIAPAPEQNERAREVADRRGRCI